MTTKAPPRITSLDELHPAFRHDVDLVLAAVADERLPFVVFETRRTIERQQHLYRLGVTRASGADGPHFHGLAFDLVLDEKNPRWAENHERPIGTSTRGVAWDTGVEWDGTRARVVRPFVASMWSRVGAIAHGVGITWGGINAGAWKSKRPGDPFGWDVGHFQAREWRRVVERTGASR